jgi:chitin synthase
VNRYTICDALFREEFFIVLAVMCIGILFIVGALHGELLHLLCNFPKYLYMLPAYVYVFNIFAFCNIHDLSWGTKGAESGEAHGASPEGEWN